ncbi:MAG: DUF11 domain-containing protein [Candidatus Peribacteraceae bacterium]|nr:DUF11 domain-containing protein [Candidatus Peribacteraceae bacterium]
MENKGNTFGKLKKLLAFTALLAVVASATPLLLAIENIKASAFECADGIDNNANGDVDYPDDAGCSSLTDKTEGDEAVGVFVNISDGTKEIKQGENLTYTIELNSTHNKDQLVDVQFKIPGQVTVSSSSNGGKRVGNYVTWKNVLVRPSNTKTIHVYVTVSNNATKDDIIIAEVVVDGKKNSDTTKVKEILTENKYPLEMEVTDGKAFAEPNEKLTYRILVKNRKGETKKYSLHTTLSSQLNFIHATGHPYEDNRNIKWDETEIKSGEVHEYFLTAQVERDTADATVLQVRIASNESFATDRTSVKLGHLDTDFKVNVSDGYETVRNGDIVRYAITVENITRELATEVDINSALPLYTEFVSASEGGYWTGKNVRWTGLTISPFGNRILFIDARIRRDAPLGQVLQHSVEVRGNLSSDISRVAEVAKGNGIGQNISAPVTLRKTADKQEVRPGDTINYTIFLRNNTNHAFTHVKVKDRMDTRYMKLISSSYGKMNEDTITWGIPELRPNEIWKVNYTIQVARNVPHGEILNNVVTVSGNGLDTISLTERVYTGETNVITDLPPTGVGIGGLFVGLTGMLGALQALVQRKKYMLFG